jgi:hypothetical protein
VNWSDLLGVLLLAVSGLLVGGAYTTWKQSRQLGVAVGIGAVLSAAAGIAWLL